MGKKIDKIDRQILQSLQIDASLSIDQLADRVHLSRNACWRRVKSLESDGIIKQRVALLDADQLELGLMAFVMIKTTGHDHKWLTKFKGIVTAMPEIVGAHRMSGELDYVLKVRIGSVQEYDRFYQSLIKQIPIASVSASFAMEDIKDTTALPI